VELSKASKVVKLAVEREPAVMTRSYEVVEEAGSVGAVSTEFWKAPFWRIWGLVREEVMEMMKFPT